jgi:hypothetical protein
MDLGEIVRAIEATTPVTNAPLKWALPRRTHASAGSAKP